MCAAPALNTMDTTMTRALPATASIRPLRRTQAAALAQRRADAGRTTTRDWLYLSAQIALVAGIELSDDVVHALLPTTNAAAGLANAQRVMDFERAHGFWLEPGIQHFFATTHIILGQAIGWAQVKPVVDALYGEGHVLFTLAFAIWVFFRRRSLFPVIRNIFVLTNLSAVALYEIFPLAPPRLATDLIYQGQPFHFIDAVFGGGSGIKLSFNDYAAMPSVHVAWALIVGLTVAWAAKPLLVRVLGLLYPLLMLTTVVVTGNHYISDGLGALAVVSVSTLVAVLIARRQANGESPARLFQRMRAGNEPVPA
jgi:membrane-associated phospholipid phosphatase